MMSVISGVLSFSDQISALDAGIRMAKSLEDIPVDKYHYWNNEKAFMSCHLQCITQESIYENMPYYDDETGIVIAANVILDNRDELLSEFKIASDDSESFPDSRVILLAYKKWGENCSEHIIGDFSYVIYETRKNRLVCSRDHAGRSTFYYVKNEHYFAFCTLMKPLTCIEKKNKLLNEQWLVDFLSIPTVVSQLDSSITVYQYIDELLPATTLIFNNDKFSFIKYWNPITCKKIKLSSSDEYDEAFREVIDKAIQCKLRSIDNIGILLSGGLDSSTVACIAAKQLEKKGKRLKAYTSIPMEGYIERLGKRSISDESPYVNEIVRMYPNIDICYCRCEGKDSIHGIEKYLNILEQPYKTVENLFWFDDIYEKAEKDNCRVLLNGQYGNITISFGSFYNHLKTLLCSLKFTKLLHEMKYYADHHQTTMKETAKPFIKGLFPKFIQFLLFKDSLAAYNRNRYKLTNLELMNKYNEHKRLEKVGFGYKWFEDKTINSLRKQIINHTAFSQSACFENKFGIPRKLITRDPTKDKRVIEFCFSIPDEQYVSDGVERVILRRAMNGILPDMVRLNYNRKGVQAADWIQRILPFWDNTYLQIENILNDQKISKYFNLSTINELMTKNKNITVHSNALQLRQLIILYIFSKFIFMNEGGD